MVKVLLVFDGGSRGDTGAGFGSYAIIQNNQRTITRLEFGNGMTPHEAGYDTLLTALEVLARQENPADITLEIQTASQLVVNQVKGTWKARTSRLSTRRDRVCEMSRRFKSFTLTRASREQVKQMLRG
jgi:ribonuclease HI